MFRPGRQSLLALTALALLGAPARAPALLNIDGTRNQIFVFGRVSFSHDSNLFSQTEGSSDSSITSSLGIELKRRAGIISVNARATFDYQSFFSFTGENAFNPNFFLELNKTVGRTTGALTVNAFRASRSDAAANVRTQTWNFPLGLSLKYPINDHLYLTSQTSYFRRSFTGDVGLTNLTDYTQALDFFYVFTSKLDLVGGYRIRRSLNSGTGNTTDHNFSLGVTNGLLPKVNGSLRFGYQLRETALTNETFTQFNISASLSWIPTRKLTVNLGASRDFSTTATGISVDTLGGDLRGTYVFTRRLSVNAGVAYSRNRFVGANQPPRQDDAFTWDAGASYSWNEHLSFGAGYSSMKNWSTNSFSDFTRSSYNLDVSSRW